MKDLRFQSSVQPCLGLAVCLMLSSLLVPSLAFSMLGFNPETIPNQEYDVGEEIGAVELPTATGGVSPFSYRLTPEILPAGLAFFNVVQFLTGRAMYATEETTYTYTVEDANGDTASLTFTLIVKQVPSFSRTIADQVYRAGVAIRSFLLPAADGTDTPLEYTISPALPMGLTFDHASRRLSGTPTVAMAKTAYTYTVRDADGDTDSFRFAITVMADQIPSFPTTIENQYYIIGHRISITLPAVITGDEPITYRLRPRLPANLNSREATLTVFGTPRVTQPTTLYTYRATDVDGDVASLRFTLTVMEDERTDFGSASIPDQQYRAGFRINPLTLPEPNLGNPRFTYVFTPALPAGLTFNAEDLTLSGRPGSRMGYTLYTYTARDKNGDEDHLRFSISIALEVGRGRPQSLALDAPNNHLYWSDPETGKIRRVNL